MAGFDSHAAAHPREEEDPAIVRRNTRLGLVLFMFYLAVYVGFVLLATFGRGVLERIGWGGVNLAVWYGFGLIGGAFLLAIIYAWICRAPRSSEGSA